MRILITGSTGYIGTRLLKLLCEEGHELIALARLPRNVKVPEEYQSQISVIGGDLLSIESLAGIPQDIDAAYYLVHSMAKKYEDFSSIDRLAAQNFVTKINETSCKQIIYLTGLISDKKHLSRHLQSRYEVEKILQKATAPLTALRAGIIIGSGSKLFEIIRDLVEKLPIMVAPKWLKSNCQPIAIRDVLYYLHGVLGNKTCLDRVFDIGGPDVLSYGQMLKKYAKKRKLHRWIITVPILTPRLSSYWLTLVTNTNYYLARTLIESVKSDAVCKEHKIQALLNQKCLNYEEALEKAFEKIEKDMVSSTWKDAWSSSGHTFLKPKVFSLPQFGCLSMGVTLPFEKSPDDVFTRILKLGDRKGWCFMNWAWRLRGLMDFAFGGVGLRKGRRSQKELEPGDTVDFWRVLAVSRKERKLVLFAEMKLPGEAWLTFTILGKEGRYALRQDAIFRPRGVLGRLYWYLFYPVHLIMFPGMLHRIVNG